MRCAGLRDGQDPVIINMILEQEKYNYCIIVSNLHAKLYHNDTFLHIGIVKVTHIINFPLRLLFRADTT